jgi:osmotically-inducible protein OsmY
MRGGLVCWPFAAIADEARAPPVSHVDTVVVTTKRLPELVPDEQLKIQVETALHDDPYFYNEHVTVTVKNGVVHLEGIVFEDGDAQDAKRIIKRKVAGVRRVVNELEICACDGGA